MNWPGLLGQFYTSLSTKANCERAVNVYCERNESGNTENPFAMYRAYGIATRHESATVARVRGSFELNDHLFLAIGNTIYELLSDYSIHATYGPIANDNGKVYMAANPTTLAIVSAGHFYVIYSAAMTEPAIYSTPLNVAFGDNYFILLFDNNTFGFSDDSTGAVWDPLDVQSAEADANILLSMIWDHETLFLFGNRVTQAFLVGSDANAPFVAQKNGVIPMGTGAAASIVALNSARYWIGQNKEGGGVCYKGVGYDFERVSTHAVENAWRAYGDISDAVAWVYQINGRNCVRFIFPTANMSWEFDTTINMWNEPLWRNPDTGLYEAHRGYCSASAFGKIVVGDRANGLLYELSPDVYTDAGDPMRWLRIAPHLEKEGDKVEYGRLTLTTNTGNGLPVAAGVDGYDPQIVMRYSDDGGDTWSNSLSRSTGRNGERRKEVFWDRGGVAIDRVYELSGSDPVKVCIAAAAFDAEVLV